MVTRKREEEEEEREKKKKRESVSFSSRPPSYLLPLFAYYIPAMMVPTARPLVKKDRKGETRKRKGRYEFI